jgi:hydrogenase maturation protease
MKPLVIGCGNPDRGDDAAGLLVARRLREMGFEAAEHTGAATDLIELWRSAGAVIVVDAVVTGAAPGAIHCWPTPEAFLEVHSPRSSTHLWGLAEAIRLAAALGRLPRELIICGIEGVRFGFGEGPGPEVAAAIDELARRIARRLSQAGVGRSALP